MPSPFSLLDAITSQMLTYFIFLGQELCFQTRIIYILLSKYQTMFYVHME
jgi:hypothetical protein